MNYVRLKRRADFGQVFKRGKTYGDRYLVLFVLNSHGRVGTRVGFTSQRNLGSAVKRNRVRRRLRALYRQYAIGDGSCGDIVILGKRPVLDASWKELQQSMRRVLRQAGCIE